MKARTAAVQVVVSDGPTGAADDVLSNTLTGIMQKHGGDFLIDWKYLTGWDDLELPEDYNPDEDEIPSQPVWRPIEEAPVPELAWWQPGWGDSVFTAMTIDRDSIAVVYFDQEKRKATLFAMLPHPEAGKNT